MSPLSDQEIAAARRVSVLEYFRTCLPRELIQVSAHDYRTKTHSSLVISDNGLFHWYSGGVGGNNAIDYLTKVEKLDFVSAVHRLNDLRPVLVQKDQRERPSSKEPRPFVQPARDNSDLKARAYLRGRGICEPVLQFCLGAGTLYQSRHGRYTNCVFLGLDANETGVEAACGHELGVCAPFGHASAIQHHDAVGACNSAQAMGDHEHRLAGAEPAHGILHERLVLGVERARRLIEQHDRRILKKCAGGGEPLALAAGEPGTVLAEARAPALRHPLDELLAMGRPCRRAHLFVGSTAPAHADVLHDRVIEEGHVLEDHRDVAEPRLLVERREVDPAR